MAKLDTPLSFTGSLGNLSAYSMRGVDKIVLRSKGGASKNKIKTHPAFANTRLNNAEFGGRAQASKFIMQALWPVKPLADYNIAGPLNSLLSHIQKLDITSAYGQRQVELSKNPKLLEGFSLNRQTTFDSMVRNALVCEISRDTHSAQLEIPALVPGINLITPRSYPYFSFMLTLGLVPDILVTDKGYAPSHPDYLLSSALRTVTSWHVMRDEFPATTLRVKLPVLPPDQGYTLLAAVGIRFGFPLGDEITQVKHAGSAKICGIA